MWVTVAPWTCFIQNLGKKRPGRNLNWVFYGIMEIRDGKSKSTSLWRCGFMCSAALWQNNSNLQMNFSCRSVWTVRTVATGSIRSDLWNVTELCTTSCFRDAAVCLLNEMHSDAQLYLLTCMTWHCWTEADRKILTIQPWLKESIFYWIDLTLTFVKTTKRVFNYNIWNYIWNKVAYIIRIVHYHATFTRPICCMQYVYSA